MPVSYNGEVLIGRGEAFIAVFRELWYWDEEVRSRQPLREDWLMVEVRSPAEDDDLAELAAAAGPVLACCVFEGCDVQVRGVSGTGQRWETHLNRDTAEQGAAIPAATAATGAAAAWAREAGLTPDEARVAEVLAEDWGGWAENGAFALLSALGLDPEPEFDAASVLVSEP